MIVPPVWQLRQDADLGYQLGEALLRNARLGVRNTSELGQAEYALMEMRGDSDTPWPGDFPLPIVAMPAKSFAPDFWTFGSYYFASRRLREALAQPEDVVEFAPIQWIRSSKAARLQEYRWMRVLARQEALDLDRCDGTVEHRPDPVTGAMVGHFGHISRAALRSDLVPRTGIFRLRESMSKIYVTDEVAERVLRAGCTGICFQHPENEWLTEGGYYRTVDGMAQMSAE